MFVGIDVAKAELVISILPAAERFTVEKNDARARRQAKPAHSPAPPGLPDLHGALPRHELRHDRLDLRRLHRQRFELTARHPPAIGRLSLLLLATSARHVEHVVHQRPSQVGFLSGVQQVVVPGLRVPQLQLRLMHEIIPFVSISRETAGHGHDGLPEHRPDHLE